MNSEDLIQAAAADYVDRILEIDLVRYLQDRRVGTESLFDAGARILVIQSLKKKNASQADAAKLLGVSPRVLNYKMAILKIRPADNL